MRITVAFKLNQSIWVVPLFKKKERKDKVGRREGKKEGRKGQGSRGDSRGDSGWGKVDGPAATPVKNTKKEHLK